MAQKELHAEFGNAQRSTAASFYSPATLRIGLIVFFAVFYVALQSNILGAFGTYLKAFSGFLYR